MALLSLIQNIPRLKKGGNYISNQDNQTSKNFKLFHLMKQENIRLEIEHFGDCTKWKPTINKNNITILDTLVFNLVVLVISRAEVSTLKNAKLC